jgi:uncharacterized SAM-binding protein YcdF (DUF218 family)
MLSGLARWIGFLTMLAGTAGAVLLVCGFFWFVLQVPTEEVELRGKADGIVVLTGAATRIPDAIELLAADRGKRLLITGVYRSTRAEQIARLAPVYAKYFKCCIDLGHAALNTFGNAIETKRWASEHNFNSLIIVTSNWHMPRAMNELRHQLPQAKLIAYPVVSAKFKSDPWWSNGATAKLLFSEYLKYLFAATRMRIDPDSGG